MRRLSGRMMGLFAAIDLTFKVLVGLAFLVVIGATGGERRAEVLELGVAIGVPIWIVWFTSVGLSTRAVDRYFAAEAAGNASDELLAKAARSCALLPRRLSALWAIEWTGMFSAIALAFGKGPSGAATALFLAALVLGSFSLAHAVTVWFTAPYNRALDRAARTRGVSVPMPPVPIRGRLMMYIGCIAVAPTAYMAAIGIAAWVQRDSFEAFAIAIAVGFGAVLVYALLTAVLIATAFTRPVVDMSDVIRTIAAQGPSPKLDRVAQHQRDEIGALAQLTNEMLERLERTEVERAGARAALEELAASLEERVKDATVKLEIEMQQRTKVQHELAIAQRIQTSILPKNWHVDGLEIAASMVPATEVGGDYYDILPSPQGGWIGIGDVSGHGLGSGLIMMMLQSVTATLVHAFPNASTRDLVVAIDRLMFENIRKRIRADDFATFTLLRYDKGGVVHYAGAHEELIVWRAASGRCERIPTPGTWIGVTGRIGDTTVENQLRLEQDDLLVLYTDGITEARSGRQQFGMDRLCEVIEKLAREDVHQIGTGVIQSVLEFCPRPQDDMSIVVARQTAPTQLLS